MLAGPQVTSAAPGRGGRALKLARKFWRKPGFVMGVMILVPMVLAAIFAGHVAPYAPDSMDGARYLPPFSPGHPLGTDNLGRDILSRLIYGGRLSLTVGLVAVGIGAGVGSVFGVIAGYVGGALDNVIMRVMDVMLAFPDILLALIIITMLGPSMGNVMIALGVAGIPAYTRLARSATLTVRELEFVEASRALGTRTFRLLFGQVLPNVIQPVIVVASLGVATSILAAAGLSFLGLGAPAGTAEWGAMLNDARNYMRRAWWLATMPGVTITLAVLSISLMSEAVREVLDPRVQ